MAYQPQFVPPPATAHPQPAPMTAHPTTYVIQPPPRPQRPAVIGMSASMTATASALWVCALLTAWLFAAAGQSRLEADQDFDGQVLILLNRFSARLLDGLAVPLFALPMIAFVAAFLLLSGTRWSQVLYTVLGALSIGWLIWWLHDSPRWALAPVAYIAVAVGIVWTPAAFRWFGRRNVP
jgi:hypothetical protein